MARLVLIQSADIQDFIFSTNKLTQNIGASELIHRIGTSFVLSAVAEEVPAYVALAERLESAARVVSGEGARRRYASKPMPTADYVAELFRIAEANPFSISTPVEVLAATSGKAVLLVDTAERGERLIEGVSRRALRKAPGAVVNGIVDDVDLDLDGTDLGPANERMTEIHKKVGALRLDLPAPEARFPTLPIVALCATSGLPAEHRDGDEYLSEPAYRKRDEALAGWRRVRAALQDTDDEQGRNKLALNLDRLDKMGLPWLAVVHADGNGFGRIFLDLARHMPAGVGGTARDYFGFYRRLSLSVEMAGVAALRDALRVFEPKVVKLRGGEEKFLPVVPLVFGGDDLTVICDGSRAVGFAKAYLEAFERATSATKIDGFPSVMPSLVDTDHEAGNDEADPRQLKFGGGAGVAIVKPHHPFHRAYDLADELTQKAKVTKSLLGTIAVSALDFQVVYQDAANDIDQHRAGWVLGDGVLLHARPYVVSEGERLKCATRNHKWAEQHHIATLRDAMRALRGTGEEDSGLPRSQQHVLRRALFEGMDIARARLEAIRRRYDIGWSAFGESNDSLFFMETDAESGETDTATGTKEVGRTRFLDALEILDIEEQEAGT